MRETAVQLGDLLQPVDFPRRQLERRGEARRQVLCAERVEIAQQAGGGELRPAERGEPRQDIGATHQRRERRPLGLPREVRERGQQMKERTGAP
jgi:hypothetical protein